MRAAIGIHSRVHLYLDILPAEVPEEDQLQIAVVRQGFLRRHVQLPDRPPLLGLPGSPEVMSLRPEVLFLLWQILQHQACI